MWSSRKVTTAQVLAILACISIPRAASPQKAGAGVDSLSGLVNAYVDPLVRMRDFEGTVLLARHGQILLSSQFTLADGKTRAQRDPGLVYGVGSVTKILTAAAVVRLSEQRRLALDAPLRTYIPEFNGSDSITLRRLLDHTSGLQDYFAWPEFAQGWRTRISDSAFIHLAESKPLDFPPGSRSSYSNTGYRLLAMAVERVAGTTFGNWIAQQIVAPAGLRDLGDFSAKTPRQLVGGLNPGAGPSRVVPAFAVDPSWAKGAGSGYSTAEDFVRLLDWMRNENRLPSPARTTTYGWGPRSRYGRDMFEQNGRVPTGYTSYVGFYPADDVVIVVLSRIQCDVAEKIGVDVAGLLFDTAVSSPTVRAGFDTAHAPDAGRGSEFAGTYDIAPGFSLQVRATPHGLELAGPDLMFIALDPESADRFFFRPLYVSIVFERNALGNVTALNWNNSFKAGRR